MTELLPCPFCGGKPESARTGFSGRAMYIYCINDAGACLRPKVVGETEEMAIKNWNTRVNSPHGASVAQGWHPTVPVDAIVNLVNHQEQCDTDGVMVKVSRQALAEVLLYVTEVRPDNKWVQSPAGGGDMVNFNGRMVTWDEIEQAVKERNNARRRA